MTLESSQDRLAWRLLSLARPHTATLTLAMIFLAGGVGVNLIIPFAIKEGFNRFDLAYINLHLSAIFIGALFLFAIQGVCFYYRSYLFNVVGQKIVANLRTKLYQAIIVQKISFFDSSRAGDLISRLSADTALLQNAVSINISVFIRYTLQVLVGILLMFLISWKLSLTILALLPVLLGITIGLGKRLKRQSRRVQEELARANIVAEETIYSVRTVKAFVREMFELGRYKEAIDGSLREGLKRSSISAVLQSFAVFLMNASLVV
ncbi:MAG: hypothetical protein KDD53_06150, partial [Bdellovibrionales bacterium]|nr:hypothetical protein [Bdellovibrionales bacterium]